MEDLFIFKDGDEMDIDCFKIHVAPADIDVVNVIVDFDPSFNGKLNYQYIYNGIEGSLQTLITGGDNIFTKDGFDDPESLIEEDVFFRIIPADEDIKCTYGIKCLNEL